MSDWTQANKPGQVTTILGADKLLLERFTADDRISSPFEIIVEGLSVDGVVDFTPHLGTGVSITAESGNGNERSFHGLLFEARSLGPAQGLVRYRLTLRPWFYLLSLGRNSRIFQDKTVKAIITQIFSDAGFSDFELDMTKAGLTPRNYCVQFRESDFDFISRLMEEEGIYYYFKHTASAHKLILCDAPSCHGSSSLTAPVVRGEPSTGRQSHLWVWDRQVRPAIIKATLHDSNFCKIGDNLQATTQETSKNAAEKAEFYDYPGGYGYHADDGSEKGDDYVAARLQEARREREIYLGHGDVFSIATGARITIDDADENTSDKQYMIVASNHAFGGQTYVGVVGSDDPVEVRVDIEGFPADSVWRPLRVTPKPIAGGPQTAIVVGQSGEVIDVDKYGRVKIQFDWDRLGTKNQNSSCWVRVSQSSADAGFGHMVIPRLGEEVIVDFFDGDPDRPIITGRVYNASMMPPYTLPDEKTKSTWKSQTIGESGAYDGAEDPPSGKGSNELRFEDKGGSEEFFIHAQRIFNAWFRLDETRKTGRDTTVRVGRDRTVAIKNNESVTIETGDETRAIKTGSRTTTIEQNDTLTLSSGDYSLKISAGQATIEAETQITLKVGENQIVISQQGIDMKGTLISMKADATLSAEGLQTELKGSAMTTISGGMVMIN